MSFGGPFTGAPGGTIAMQCLTGFVYLYRFFAAPAPGTIIGQITTFYGSSVPLVQTEATPLGGTPLSSVDGEFAQVCGLYTTVGGQVALDVRVVSPGAPSPTGTPYPYNKWPYGYPPYPYGYPPYPYGYPPYPYGGGYGGSGVRFLGPPVRP